MLNRRPRPRALQPSKGQLIADAEDEDPPGAAKRIKITGTGKVMMMSHHRNNKRMKKPAEKLTRSAAWSLSPARTRGVFAGCSPTGSR